MSTIKGLGLTDAEPQPGFTATKAENGGWTGKHTFAIRRTAWANASVRNKFAKGISITTLDPDLSGFWSFLKTVETEVTSEEGDFTMVSVTLSGAQGATYGEGGLGEDAEPTYRLSGQLQDAPFSEHPKWKTLTEKQQTALGHLINGVMTFDEETGKISTINPEAADSSEFFDPFLPYDEIVVDDCLEFAKLISKGESTYLRPVITWTESTEGNDGLTNAQLNKLGNIATPRGNPPEAAGTRDWMLTSAFQEQQGELIRTDLEWTLSENGGHSSFLYTESEE
jgi:hypothetical protein